MRHIFIIDQSINDSGIDVSNTDMGRHRRCHAPGECPAITLKHWQRPLLDRSSAQAYGDHVAQRIQVGSTMVVYATFRITGGSRRI